MLEHNVGFSVAGKIQQFRKSWERDLSESIIRILIQFRDSLQQMDKPPSMSSEPSIQ